MQNPWGSKDFGGTERRQFSAVVPRGQQRTQDEDGEEWQVRIFKAG